MSRSCFTDFTKNILCYVTLYFVYDEGGFVIIKFCLCFIPNKSGDVLSQMM